MDVLNGSGTPIVNLKDSDFEVIEEDLPGRVTAFRGPQSQAINLVLVIDVSGSMHSDNRIEGAKNSAIAVVEALKDDRDRLAMIPFSNTMRVLRPLEVLTAANRSRCHDLIRALFPSGGTSIGPPTIEALNLYREGAVDGVKMVMVMTDGEDKGFPQHIEEIVQLSEEVGAQVHTIGFGSEVGHQAAAAMEQVARRCSGQYQHAPTNEELTRIFNARVQETVNECTLVYDSPYPQSDGLPRKVDLRLKSPGGLVNAAFSYQVGPILGGRSTPAAWATTKGKTDPAASVVSFVFPLMLFIVLFAALVAGLFASKFALGRAGETASATAALVPAGSSGTTPSQPKVSLPPPPTKSPPNAPVMTTSTITSKAGDKPSPKIPVPNSNASVTPNRPASSQQTVQSKPTISLPPPPKPK